MDGMGGMGMGRRRGGGGIPFVLAMSSLEAHIPPYGIFWRILVAEIERC